MLPASPRNHDDADSPGDLRSWTGTRSGRGVPALDGVPLRNFRVDAFLREAMHPDDVEPVRAAITRLAADEADSYRIEYRSRHGEEWRWMESFGSVVERDAEDRPTRIAFSDRDVRQAVGTLPISEGIGHRTYSIPWFKHYRPEIIEQHANAFRKVAENYTALLADDPGDPPALGGWHFYQPH